MDKSCLSCLFSSPVLCASKELICELDQELVSMGHSCDLFAGEHEFDVNPEFDDYRDAPEECWLED